MTTATSGMLSSTSCPANVEGMPNPMLTLAQTTSAVYQTVENLHAETQRKKISITILTNQKSALTQQNGELTQENKALQEANQALLQANSDLIRQFSTLKDLHHAQVARIQELQAQINEQPNFVQLQQKFRQQSQQYQQALQTISYQHGMIQQLEGIQRVQQKGHNILKREY